MKLLRHTPANTETLELQFTIHEEMVSHDVAVLKAKAVDLCKRDKLLPHPWVSKYPIMGKTVITPDIEWVMELSNETFFTIEK